MDKLLKFTHSNSIKDTFFIKLWRLSINNIVYTLEYEELHSELKSSTFYLKSICNKKTSTVIYNIEEWVAENIIHLEKSENNYKKCIKLTDYINEHIGDKTQCTLSEVEWSIPGYLRLSIKFYDTVTPNNEPYILLVYKEKEVFLSEYKLKKFINNNKKTIIQKKAYHLKKKGEELLTKEKPTILKTPLVNRYNLFIKRTIRQRYESQACKPFIENHTWNTQNE